jgi:hypothetical protein
MGGMLRPRPGQMSQPTSAPKAQLWELQEDQGNWTQRQTRTLQEAMQQEEQRMLEEERYQRAEVMRRDAELVRRMVAVEAETGGAKEQPDGPSEGLHEDKKGKGKLAFHNPVVETVVNSRRWEHTVAKAGEGSVGSAAAAPGRGLEADAYAHAAVMACFADGLPLVEPGRRQLVEGVSDWVENSKGAVQVATPHGSVRPLRVLLNGGSYYTLVGAKLKVQLGMEEADMDGRGQNFHTATGKVEPLKGGLTKQPVPIILNANTLEELTICEHVAFTDSNGYDLLIGTRASYPSGLSVDRWAKEAVYRAD